MLDMPLVPFMLHANGIVLGLTGHVDSGRPRQRVCQIKVKVPIQPGNQDAPGAEPRSPCMDGDQVTRRGFDGTGIGLGRSGGVWKKHKHGEWKEAA